jgi:aminoglycoside/choline kinase family phosphotransferase
MTARGDRYTSTYTRAVKQAQDRVLYVSAHGELDGNLLAAGSLLAASQDRSELLLHNLG